MTDEILSQMLSSELNREFERNEPEIIKVLLSALPDDKQIDPDLQNLLIASVRASVQLSIHLTIRLLEGAGVLGLSPDGEPILRVVPEK